MDVRILGLTAGAIAGVAIAARMLWLFSNRMPVLAHAENTDATLTTSPSDPLNGADPRDLLISPVLEPPPVNMRVDYEVGGQHYEHQMVSNDDMPIIWVDPENPVHVERYDLRFCVTALLAISVAAVAVCQLTV